MVSTAPKLPLSLARGAAAFAESAKDAADMLKIREKTRRFAMNFFVVITSFSYNMITLYQDPFRISIQQATKCLCYSFQSRAADVCLFRARSFQILRPVRACALFICGVF
jgi:hypothetical protein